MFDRQRKYLKKNGQFAKVVAVLNSAFLVSALSDRLWSFSMGIIMHQLGGMSWVAIQQLIDNAVKLSLATKMGSILDRMNRLRGIQFVLLMNNFCIVLSTIGFYLLFVGYGAGSNLGFKILLATSIILGSLSRVASDAQKTAFTKDWVVVLIENSNGASRLSTQNAILNMIDQLACLVAPIIAGGLLDRYQGAISCLIILVWNVISCLVEMSVMMWIYSVTPELEKDIEIKKAEESSSAFQKYFRQRAFRAMFGLSLLYMTVLGFDNIAISYGTSQGLTAQQLGIFRSIGSLLGFAGNAAYSILERWIGVLLTAFIGLALQNICINLCTISVFLPGNQFNLRGYVSNFDTQEWWNTAVGSVLKESGNSTMAVDVPLTQSAWSQLSASILVFFVGITSARFGLWMADSAITQIMQETIPEAERYSVNAAQNVICEVFSIMKDFLIILFPTNATFGALTITSVCFVFAGYMFYTSYFIPQACGKNKTRQSRETTELKLPEREHLINTNLVEHALRSA